jgi:hypothetical protein
MVDKYRVVRMRNLIKAQKISKYEINNIKYREEEGKIVRFTVTKYTQRHRHKNRYRHFYNITYVGYDLGYCGRFKRPSDYWNYYTINSISFTSYVSEVRNTI